MILYKANLTNLTRKNMKKFLINNKNHACVEFFDFEDENSKESIFLN
jgi:hypothetical protein